jgi:hypothetical protein
MRRYGTSRRKQKKTSSFRRGKKENAETGRGEKTRRNPVCANSDGVARIGTTADVVLSVHFNASPGIGWTGVCSTAAGATAVTGSTTGRATDGERFFN